MTQAPHPVHEFRSIERLKMSKYYNQINTIIIQYHLNDLYENIHMDPKEKYTKEEQEKTYQAKLDATEADGARTRRNELLAETDFYALSDVTMTDEIKTYRQALRDLPSHKDWPYVDFPTKP